MIRTLWGRLVVCNCNGVASGGISPMYTLLSTYSGEEKTQ